MRFRVPYPDVTDRRRSDKHQTSTRDEVLKSQLESDCDWNQSPVIDSINQTSLKIASIKKTLEISLGLGQLHIIHFQEAKALL
jgi:hypothetical protein